MGGLCMPAILFGSISTIADTSELQREAFNEAFAEHGLDWSWEPPEYRKMLVSAGGQARIEEYARSKGVSVDAGAIHATKSALFRQRLAASNQVARPGVAGVIAAAHQRGERIALVTTTSMANVDALLRAVAKEIPREAFDVVIEAGNVDQGKPDPAAFTLALERLGETAGDCVAIEDNLDGVSAATAAGLAVFAFPNEGTTGHDFTGATATVDRLDIDELSSARSSK
jgi:HAD superfamily hydrolase (TIGR01509 family)